MTKRIVPFMALVLHIFLLQSYSFAQSLPLFGPNKYARAIGAPNTYSVAFQACNTGATYNLIVENGEEKKDRLSSASITLNGIEIVRESEFNQNVDTVEKNVALQQENTLNIKLASGPGGFIKVSIYCVANCLEVSVTSPSDGNTINRSTAIVQGRLYNASGEVGVILRSSGVSGQVSGLAQTQGTNPETSSGQTFAGIIPLQQGQNTITAQVTDACGYKATDTITINTETIEEQVRLTAIPSSGIPILDVTLEAEIFLTNPVFNYSWDFDGDGTPDQTGTTLSKLTTQYQYPGLYFPKVIITDTQGNAYEETAIINVLSREEMEALLKGKWEGMKGKLVSGDVEGALRYIAGPSQKMYRYNFELMSAILPTIAQDMGRITLVNIMDNVAEYEMIAIQDGQTFSFYVEFVRDVDGIWRIRFY